MSSRRSRSGGSWIANTCSLGVSLFTENRAYYRVARTAAIIRSRRGRDISATPFRAEAGLHSTRVVTFLNDAECQGQSRLPEPF